MLTKEKAKALGITEEESEALKLTKEEKVLWATWMASTDIWEYAVDIILDFNQMDEFELDRVRKNGLRIIAPWGEELLAYPVKSYTVPDVILLESYNEGLKELVCIGDGVRAKRDKIIVEELKRIDFIAPWVSGMDVKNILYAKWGENWADKEVL